MPQVSVVIATYNRAGFICDAIDSVLAQTFTDYEILVVDDGSTDRTPQVLEKYGDRIRYFCQAHRWQAAALNRGIRESRGTYIAFLDDDDIWLPDKLAVQMRFLQDHPSTGVVCSRAWSVNLQGEVVGLLQKRNGNDGTFVSLYEQHCSDIVFASLVVRKEILEEVGGLDETLKSTQDFDLYLRLAKKHPVVYLDIPLLKYRWHHHTKTNDKVQKCRDRLRVITKPEHMAHLTFLGRRIRIAKEYSFFAGAFKAIGDYRWTSRCYWRAVLSYPLVGAVYPPEETPRSWGQRPYQVLRAYGLAVYCSCQMLRAVVRPSLPGPPVPGERRAPGGNDPNEERTDPEHEERPEICARL